MSGSNAHTVKKSGAAGNTHVYSDGVVVKRNADGTIETYEARPTLARSAYRSLVKPKPVPPYSSLRRKRTSITPRTKYSDGVTIKRIPDGTVETFESGSLSTIHPSDYTTVPSNCDDVTVKRNPDGSYESYESAETTLPQNKRLRNSVYKTSDGITVKRNADGTVETYENSGHYSSKVKGHKKH